MDDGWKCGKWTMADDAIVVDDGGRWSTMDDGG